ncbi:MAG: hypothetical protein P1P88_00625 [Bacteroidales bacterium]|nr:hypothetical protein [Bacteroidales bacterium]
MRKIQIYFMFVFVFLLAAPFLSIAQEEETDGGFGDFDVSNPMEQQSSLGALLGFTDIGGQQFIGMRIQPEFALGKLGFGLDIPLLFSINDGSFRTEEFNDGVGWLRMIRYVRWGVKKRDPVYIRVGDLTGSWIGYGMLLDNYTNSTSFEKRKLGATFDVLIGNLVGIEGLYSDFDMTSFNLFAIRPYVKPFGRTRIPIVRTMDMGVTYLTDHDQTYIDVNDSVRNQFNKYLDKGINAWALDIGVMPVTTSFMQVKVYAQYGNLGKNKSDVFSDALDSIAFDPNTLPEDSARMRNYEGSSGFGVGVDFKFKAGGNVLRVDARIERLWYKKYFMPQFFNAGYEFNKDAKFIDLANADGKKGIYGALAVTALEKVRIGGSLMIPDNVSETAPATVTLDLDASRLFEKFVITGQYIKGGLVDLKDAFKRDERSLLTTRVAYKMYKFLVVGMDYKWTWAKLEDGTFKATHYASPYFGLQLPLNFGNQDKGIDFNLDETE